MPLTLKEVRWGPLEGWSVMVPDGVMVGLVGREGCGVAALMRLLGGRGSLEGGTLEAPQPVGYAGWGDPLPGEQARLVLIDHALSCQDPVARARSLAALEQRRRQGAIVVIASHDEVLLGAYCDELWWVEEGRLRQRGHPQEVLAAYRRDCAARLRAEGEQAPPELRPALRRGDGRAELESICLRGEGGAETMTWRSGEMASVEVVVRYRAVVEDPVVGIMIRTRIGFEVYGTNTELERVRVGPCEAGERRRVTFRFRCHLCPQEYTLTAASHDPDGVWHDWLEDAVAFTVVDERYTAGVANLRAEVSVEALGSRS